METMPEFESQHDLTLLQIENHLTEAVIVDDEHGQIALMAAYEYVLALRYPQKEV